MKRFLIRVLTCLIFLLPVSAGWAEDPLSPEQRAWIKGHGTIRIGVASYYPPFAFVDKTGIPKGMSIDFWRLLSSRLEVWIQFYPTSFSQQLKGLKSGRYDSLGGIFPLRERKEFFDFSKPYTLVRTNIYVKPKYFHLKSLDDLKELKVSVVEEDSGQAIARKAGLAFSSYNNYREAVFDLADGGTDAIIMDEQVVVYFASEYDLQDKIGRISQPVDKGEMTLPVLKGNTVLLEILNKGIDMVSKDEWRKIEEEWLGQGY
ncbi:MAG: transporter substrate-binding domain-containing protein [Thermodesulfobacteriota bacterium]|nr:transporter substrate-binding domain-containing protein [Thermodesulfobacteriota bacterium]